MQITDRSKDVIKSGSSVELENIAARSLPPAPSEKQRRTDSPPLQEGGRASTPTAGEFLLLRFHTWDTLAPKSTSGDYLEPSDHEPA